MAAAPLEPSKDSCEEGQPLMFTTRQDMPTCPKTPQASTPGAPGLTPEGRDVLQTYCSFIRSLQDKERPAAPLFHAWEDVQEEISCGICHGLLTWPKELPCVGKHSFCRHCLEKRRAGKDLPFSCPTCFEEVHIPSQGIPGLTNSHKAIVSLCDQFRNKTTTNRHYSGNWCSFHPTEELKLYCRPCQVPVCNECLDEVHGDHSTVTLKKAFQGETAVQEFISGGWDLLESYCSFIRGLTETGKMLGERKRHTDESIADAYDNMIQALTRQKEDLLSQVDQKHRQNVGALRGQRDRVLADIAELSAACCMAEQGARQGGADFLIQETSLMQAVGKYRAEDVATPTHTYTQSAIFRPTDTTVPTIGHVTFQSLPSLHIKVDHEKHREKAAPTVTNVSKEIFGSVDSIEATEPKQEAAPLPLTAVTASPSNNAALATTRHHDNHSNHGNHKVTFGGRGSGQGEFDGPSGVTVTKGGEIFVTDHRNHRIQVFDLLGTFLRQFKATVTDEETMLPEDVAMDGEGRLWVVGDLYAVQYTQQGTRLGRFEVQSTPHMKGIAVDTGQNLILVSMAIHAEVQVFRPDGALVGSVGWQQGMKDPWHIAVDGDGNILVSDYVRHCVQAYDKKGQSSFKFGGKGSGKGRLLLPRGVCVDGAGNIVVADAGNGRLELFDKTGWFLRHLTTGLRQPCAVAMATQGQLVVTDTADHTVTIFYSY